MPMNDLLVEFYDYDSMNYQPPEIKSLNESSIQEDLQLQA